MYQVHGVLKSGPLIKYSLSKIIVKLKSIKGYLADPNQLRNKIEIFLNLLILNKKLSKITRSFFISIKQPTLRLWDFWYSVSADFKNEFEFDLGVEDLNTKKATPHNILKVLS